MQSSYRLFLFKLRWVRRIWGFISNPFWREDCWYLAEASPAIVMISYVCTDIIISKAGFWNMVRKRAAAFQVWDGQESWKFRSCTVKITIFKHGLMVVGSGTWGRLWCRGLKRAERESKNKTSSTVNTIFFCFINTRVVGLFSWSFLRTGLALPFRRWLSFRVCSLCPWWEWQTFWAD